MKRTETRPVFVGNVQIGHQDQCILQSMTNIPSKQIEKTVAQVLALEQGVAHAEMRFVARGVLSIGCRDLECGDGIVVLAQGGIGLAEVAVDGTACIVRAVGHRLLIRIDGRIEVMQAQKCIADLVIEETEVSRSLFDRVVIEALDVRVDRRLIVAGRIGGLGVVDVTVFHVLVFLRSDRNPRNPNRGSIGILDDDGFDDVAHAQLADDVFAFDRLAEHGVVGVEEMLGAEAEIELRTGGIRLGRTRHRERAVLVGIVRIGGVFLFDGISRTARAQSAEGAGRLADDLFRGESARIGVAALDHEIRHIAMELQAVVEALPGKLDEITHMNRSIVTGQLDTDDTLGGGDDGDFLAIGFI